VEYRRLGASGLLVSAVGLGTNDLGSRLDVAAARAVVDTALEAGVTFIDTADIYGKGGSESVLGLVLGSRRSQVLLATKFGGAFVTSPGSAGRHGTGS
jgi:aryl-alcohol dehydrogenase-like predicted oxidoreductase